MKKKKEFEIVESVESLQETLLEVRKAQSSYATFTQEQVDRIFKAAAIAANKARIPLAKMAVEETGMGVVEDKVIKNNYAAEYIYNAYKDTKTCGVIEEDKQFGIRKIAEPIGVIAAVIPTTNPTSTAIFKLLLALKTRNGIILSPHPRAKLSTIAAAKIVLEAAVEAGVPEGIIRWIDVPSLELTNVLMREVDIILATGGPAMVKAAYSSGKPAIGVGPGNTPAIIDDSADIILAVSSIIHSKTFDNGVICASEQSVIVLDKVYEQVKQEFAYRGCYFLAPEELEKVRKTIPVDEIDVVIPIPDSSRPSAMQLAQTLGIPFREGFVKNRYVGRTFIMPGQAQRKRSVRQKLNAMSAEFKGKNVLIVDDSIVRGTTSREIVEMARAAGANKVTFTSAAPPVRFPHVYGINMPSRQELIAHGRKIPEIAQELGADHLIYQEVADMEAAIMEGSNLTGLDVSCFTGEYVTGTITPEYLDWVERNQLS